MMTKQYPSQSIPCTPQSGYTLIQMSISLLVLGIIVGSFIQVYSLYKQTQSSITTRENIDTIISKIQSYKQGYGFYPCPAPINVARDNAGYGVPTDYATYANATTYPVGTCTNGICIERSTRTISGVTPRVRVGAIPFRQLQMDEETTFDGYGSRIWYAVTEDMCNITTFDETRGGINIVNERDEPQINPAGSASFIVFSAGPNKIGAYSKYGQLSSACNNTLDSGNCRDVSNPAQTDLEATYVSSYTANTNSAAVYDDIVQFFASGVDQVWRRDETTGENIVLNSSNVVVGSNSTGSNELTVVQSTVDNDSGSSSYGQMVSANTIGPGYESGAIRAEGSVMAEAYCNEANGNCFQASDVAGNPAAGTGGLRCPTGTGYIVGIGSNGSNAEPICDDIKISCPPGQVMTGFTTSGSARRPACSPSAFETPCPASTHTECPSSGAINIPAQASGTYYPASGTITTGDCMQLRFRCNNGTWNVSSRSGYCTAVTDSGTADCGEGYTGTFTWTYNSCVGYTHTWGDYCPPTCVPYDTTTTNECAYPSTGAGTTTVNHYECDASNNHYLASTTTNGAGCSCGLTDSVTFSDCPSGYTRSANAPGTYPWPSDTSRGCVAAVTVDTASCTTSTSSSTCYCECDTTPQYSSELAAVPACKVAQSGSRTVNGTSYSYAYDVYRTDIIEATCSAGTKTLVDPAQFNDVNYYWREMSGGVIQTVDERPSSSTPDLNSGCTCSTQAGVERTCVRSNSSGGYNVYNCRCGE